MTTTTDTVRRMGPRGNLETFFDVNAPDIPATDRAKMREAAVKAIQGAAICTRHCPEHLRDAFRLIVTEAAYQVRVAGQKVNPKSDVMPVTGKPDARQSKNSRL